MDNPFDREPTSADDPHANDWADYSRIILANIWLILAVTSLFCLGSIVYFSSLPNLYTASVQILVEKVEETQKSSQSMLMPNFKGEEDYYGTQVAILTGRKISGRVAEELNPVPVYSLSARRLVKTRILQLLVTQRDPVWAAKIANKFAEIYVRESNSEQLFIGQQMLKLIPEEVETEGRKLISETGHLEELQGFNKQEYAESLTAIMNDPVIRRMQNEKVEAQSQLIALSQRYKPSHPWIKERADRLAYVDNELKDRTRRILNNIRANLSGANKITNIKVLEEAIPPREPSYPNRPRGITVYTILGFFVSIALVVTLEQTNQKIRTEKDFQNVPLPFLGSLPLIPEFAKKKKKSIELKQDSYSLVDMLKKDPILSDAVANIRTHILFSMPYEKSKRIMLTSCIPDEGKTTVSVLLALSLTTLGRNILFVDADMRRPFAHNYMGARNEKGLSDYLTGQATEEEVIRSVEGCSLKLISGGSKSPSPSELVASDRFRQLLDYANDHFDRIVIDVPPVLFIPDGLIVAKHVHSGVLVCGSGMVHKKTVQAVKSKFDSIGHSFIGIIINKVDYSKGTHRYKYYSSYKSYYTRNQRSQTEIPQP